MWRSHTIAMVLAAKRTNWASLVSQMVKNLPCNSGDQSSVPGLGRFPQEVNGYPLQYFCLENPMDRGG